MDWMDQFVDKSDLVEVIFPEDEYPHTTHEYREWISEPTDFCDPEILNLSRDKFDRL